MTKLPKKLLTTNFISLKRFQLDATGLEIIGKCGNHHVTIKAPPAEAALILLDNDIIQDCYVGHCDVVIRWGWIIESGNMGERIQDSGTAEMCWSDFVKAYNLSELEAETIVANRILKTNYLSAAA